MKPRTRGQRIMHRGYADIMHACVNGATWADVAAKVNLTRITAQTILHAMVDLGLVHEAGAKSISDKRVSLTPIYRIGEGGRVDWPGRQPRAAHKPPAELIAFASAVRELQRDGLNGKQLRERTGLGQRSAQRLLTHMHALRLVHIDDYPERSFGGYGYPIYTWGNAPDAKKPPPRGKEANTAAWNARAAARRRDARLLGLMAKNQPRVAEAA